MGPDLYFAIIVIIKSQLYRHLCIRNMKPVQGFVVVLFWRFLCEWGNPNLFNLFVICLIYMARARRIRLCSVSLNWWHLSLNLNKNPNKRPPPHKRPPLHKLQLPVMTFPSLEKLNMNSASLPPCLRTCQRIWLVRKKTSGPLLAILLSHF